MLRTPAHRQMNRARNRNRARNTIKIGSYEIYLMERNQRRNDAHCINMHPFKNTIT